MEADRWGEERAAAGAGADGLTAALDWLDAIYEAGLDPARWRRVLGRMASTFDCPRVLLARERGETWEVLAASDLDLPAAAREGGGRLELVPRLGEVTAVVASLDRELRLIVGRGGLTSAERRLLERLASHVSRARHFARLAARPGRERALGWAALDRLALAVLVVEPDGGILETNAAAREMLAARDGISELQGRLIAAHLPTHGELAPLVARMAKPLCDRTSGAALRLPRNSRRAPLEALVVPLPDERAGERPAPCALVFVFDPERPGDTPAAVLRRLYDLTGAEARVVARILQGENLERAAGSLGVSSQTVRSHLKRIFAKIGTTRQSDLVRLLIAGPAGMRWG